MLEFNGLTIFEEKGRFFVIYDAGAHQVAMRKDEISVEEATLGASGKENAIEMLYRLQKRLLAAGIDPYRSNTMGE